MQRLRLLSYILILFCLVACGTQQPISSTPQPDPTNTTFASPLESPLATPNVSRPWPDEPEPGKSHIRGVLYREANNQPLEDVILYLVELLPLSGGVEDALVPSLDAETAPRALSNVDGTFEFLNLQPGRYALGAATPTGPILLREFATQAEIIVSVSDGEMVDLEVMVVFYEFGP